ncbi:MAG: 2,3-bisphosphoglycerate-independent phosphoglycerate mutase [Solirubrobacteraceae bacterium]
MPVPHVCLVVMDGWGMTPPGPANAIALADTPVFDRLCREYPPAELDASGPAVGLPEGQMGNSEVGHLTLGAGSVVPQTLTLIDHQVATGGLAHNEVIRRALMASERVHLIGMVSDGGVHSSLAHLVALIDLAAELGVPDLVLHCFTDGRDTPPTSGAGFIERAQEECERAGAGRIASVVGRYWAMDRDRRWQRTQSAYDLLVHGRGAHHLDDAVTAVRAAYARGETDEFIAPTGVGADGRIAPGDSVLCFNFRPDRMRQIVRALAEPGFGEGDEDLPGWSGRGGASPVAALTTMTAYQRGWSYPVAFEAAHPATTLGAVIEQAGATQLHVAETEKYAHVTYFFNGGREQPYAGERRELVPSQRDVATYDLKPEMSAAGIAERFVAAFEEDRPRFAVVNFANADMVGHTGVLDATVRAVETVDTCLRRIVDCVAAAGGVCVITADHGNAEEMLDPDGGPGTTHSCNRVPLVVTVPGLGLAARGTLADVAPTVLELLGMEAPAEMTGHSLVRAVTVVSG